jgi:hypothetical protein
MSRIVFLRGIGGIVAEKGIPGLPLGKLEKFMRLHGMVSCYLIFEDDLDDLDQSQVSDHIYKIRENLRKVL